MPDITYDYVIGVRKHLEDVWRPARAKWQEWHDLHDQKHLIRFSLPADVRKLGIARSKVSAMVDTLITNEPTVSRKLVKEGQAHEDNADKAENWGKGLLRRVAVAGGPVPPFRTAAYFLALLGYTTGVWRWDDKLWDATPTVKRGPGYSARLEEAKAQQARGFPYVIEFPHPARILLPHQERKPSIAIELASMYGWQVEKMLEREAWEKVGDLHANPYDILEVMNYWDEEKRGLFINKVEVEVRDNGFGFVPFGHAFSGYGHESMPAIWGSHGSGTTALSMGPNPEDEAVGILAGAEDSIKALDEFSTSLGFLVGLASYTNYFTTGNADEINKQRVEGGLGGAVHVEKVEDMPKPSEIPQLGAWVFQHKESLRQNIDELTFQGVVAGQMSPNVPMTATGQAMQLGEARHKFGMPMTQLNLLAGEFLGMSARATVLKGAQVEIDGVSCGEKEFEGNYEFQVDFMSKDEGQKLRDTAAANEGFKAGTSSFEEVQTAKGVTDVTGMRDEVTIDKAWAMPVVMETLVGMAVEEVKRRIEEKKAKEAAKNGAPPAPPLVGANPIPAPGTPQSFIPMPGGPTQAAQVQQGMEQVPGAGMAQTMPGA